MATLDEKTQYKVKQGLLLLATQPRLSVKYVKSLKNGLYELRIMWDGNIYRVFFIFDKEVILTYFKHTKYKKEC